ncbi:MAG: hypothetical protein GX621_11095 [Pirellulaceae bacterium]|nr:hypothetical protein [Pirellulaceae bacterium]
MRRFVTLFLFAFLVLASARGWAVEADPISPGSWTMIILPDTQYYAESFPHIFHAQTEWIAAHKDSHNIQMVIHEGDRTNRQTPIEWARGHGLSFDVPCGGVGGELAARRPPVVGGQQVVRSALEDVR